ncbi:Ryanodine receptor [Nymphon striatum]|nr:Ryanodine receptor [Nymphon striatum]
MILLSLHGFLCVCLFAVVPVFSCYVDVSNAEQNSNSRNKSTESIREDSKTATDKNRFASAFLEKMLIYLDSAAVNMKVLKPSNNCSHRSSFRTSTRDVKFFSKVVLSIIEKYFPANRDFFLTISSTNDDIGAATIDERKMVANLFCKLSSLIRAKMSVFGSDARLTVRCLQVLIKASDCRTLVKSCPDFVKTSMLTFFNYAADDLENTVINLQQGRYCQIRGTTMKTSTSLNYIQLVLLPVLTALFDHLATYDFGEVLLTDDIQVACYKILHSVFQLGTDQKLFTGR